MDQATTSSGVSIGGGSSLDQEDAERFRKRMELEQVGVGTGLDCHRERYR